MLISQASAYIESSAGQKSNQGAMHEYAMKAKRLEINPRSPLIDGILRRVSQLPSEEEFKDFEAEEELKEVTSILIDGALVRSGFAVTDSHRYDNFHGCPTIMLILQLDFSHVWIVF